MHRILLGFNSSFMQNGGFIPPFFPSSISSAASPIPHLPSPRQLRNQLLPSPPLPQTQPRPSPQTAQAPPLHRLRSPQATLYTQAQVVPKVKLIHDIAKRKRKCEREELENEQAVVDVDKAATPPPEPVWLLNMNFKDEKVCSTGYNIFF